MTYRIRNGKNGAINFTDMDGRVSASNRTPVDIILQFLPSPGKSIVDSFNVVCFKYENQKKIISLFVQFAIFTDSSSNILDVHQIVQ